VTELERIERQHRNCSPHIKQRQTWKDMDALLAVARAAQEYIDYKDSGKLVHYGGSTRLDKVRAALSALAGKEQT
jgi:hypothetical protein